MLHFLNIENQKKGRVEGVAKVTGKATYSAEYDLPDLAYGVLVGSTITSGVLKNLDVEEAKQAPGVIDILSYYNKPEVSGLDDDTIRNNIAIHNKFFHTTEINFNDQPIALIVAESFEDASYAATLIKADYEERPHDVDFKGQISTIEYKADGDERGTLDAWKDAPYIIENEYAIAMEVHNPMEMHATIAHWTDDGKLTLYDKSQGVNGVQRSMSRIFGLEPDDIHVNSEFVGGGFGSGLWVWFNTVAATMAAKLLERPVKVMLTRPQMFTSVGYRPESWQHVRLGATSDGVLLGIHHKAIHNKSIAHHFKEGITGISRKVYGLKNVKAEYGLAPLHLSSPTWMRGPGDSTGTFAVESAIDELCYKLDMDPVALRLKNIAPYDMESGLPWSSHYLNECLERGAQTIGWHQRPSKPKQLKEADWYTGYGMAVGLWTAFRNNAGASIEMKPNGDITVRTAMTDIGTGTGQAMVNMSHMSLGIPKEKISVELGNSIHPKAATQGGSWGLSSLSGAIDAACTALKKSLADYAWGLTEVSQIKSIILSENGFGQKGQPETFMTYQALFEKHDLNTIMVEEYSGPGEERETYGFCSSAAHFYKVKVHAITGKVKMDRMVIVVDAGTVINPQAAANQIIGAGVGGVGMALSEKQEVDQASGRLIGNDFAGYHVAVNADVPIIEVSFINKPDPHINPMGAKGLGEVGLIGSAPAITNAIYNAIGKRFTSLPVTPDKVLLTESDM